MKDLGVDAAASPLLSNVLLALAERCEREEPSFELGYAIHKAIAPPNDLAQVILPYTTSLDAAVSLVPAGAWRETNGPRHSLNIPSPVPNFWKTEIDLWKPAFSMHMGWAATEALSICAAALKARAGIAKAEAR